MVAATALQLGGGSDRLGWPTGSVVHRYHDTANGQLHYVKSRLPGANWTSAPLVFLHAHPRSTVEFRYVAEALSGAPFIAVDYFGMGQSEDYLPTGPSAPQFCSFQALAAHVLDILKTEGVSEFVPVGHAKGAHPTIELAAAAGRGRVRKVIIMNPLILSPAAKAFIDNKLIPLLKGASLATNGSHLLAAWNDPSAAPMGPGGQPSAEPRDLLANEEKTADSLRGIFTSWQYDMAWTAYNELNEPRMSEVDRFASSLFLYGSVVLATDAKARAVKLQPHAHAVDIASVHGSYASGDARCTRWR